MRFDSDRMQKQITISNGREKAKNTVPGGKRDLKIIIGIFAALIILSVILIVLP